MEPVPAGRGDLPRAGGEKAKPGKVCYPLRADGTIQQPRLADLDGEGYGRALSPLIKAGIGDLEQLAAMDAGDCLASRVSARRRSTPCA